MHVDEPGASASEISGRDAERRPVGAPRNRGTQGPFKKPSIDFV